MPALRRLERFYQRRHDYLYCSSCLATALATGPGHRKTSFRNRSGRFANRNRRTRYECDRLRVFHDSNRYRSNMGAWAVPACISASSEAILAVTGFPRMRGFRGVRASYEIDAAGGRATEGRPSGDHSFPQESPPRIQWRKFHGAFDLSGTHGRSLPSIHRQSLRVDAINLVDMLPPTTNHFRSTYK